MCSAECRHNSIIVSSADLTTDPAVTRHRCHQKRMSLHMKLRISLKHVSPFLLSLHGFLTSLNTFSLGGTQVRETWKSCIWLCFVTLQHFSKSFTCCPISVLIKLQCIELSGPPYLHHAQQTPCFSLSLKCLMKSGC